jgi:pimeloyl-ACP methyl ester carboxylesterase
MKNNEHVILIHGLARTYRTWFRMQKILSRNGYQVINLAYPSRKKPIEELASRYINNAIEQCRDNNASRIHFVTHSMGAILVRSYLSQQDVDELGHVVMLSPPNKGSELVDKLSFLPGFKKLNGPAGYQLSTLPNSLPNQLGPVDYSVGIITGNRSFNPVLSLLIPGADDGKVSVESAKLEGMHDFLVMPSTHPFIMQNNRVIHQTCQYLSSGSFYR